MHLLLTLSLLCLAVVSAVSMKQEGERCGTRGRECDTSLYCGDIDSGISNDAGGANYFGVCKRNQASAYYKQLHEECEVKKQECGTSLYCGDIYGSHGICKESQANRKWNEECEVGKHECDTSLFCGDIYSSSGVLNGVSQAFGICKQDEASTHYKQWREECEVGKNECDPSLFCGDISKGGASQYWGICKKNQDLTFPRIVRKKDCVYLGTVYRHGESYKQECNRCTCHDGEPACTKKMCMQQDAIPQINNVQKKNGCNVKGKYYYAHGQGYYHKCIACSCSDGYFNCMNECTGRHWSSWSSSSRSSRYN